MRNQGILLSTDGPYDNVIKIKPPLVFTKLNVLSLHRLTHAFLKQCSMLMHGWCKLSTFCILIIMVQTQVIPLTL